MTNTWSLIARKNCVTKGKETRHRAASLQFQHSGGQEGHHKLEVSLNSIVLQVNVYYSALLYSILKYARALGEMKEKKRKNEKVSGHLPVSLKNKTCINTAQPSCKYDSRLPINHKAEVVGPSGEVCSRDDCWSVVCVVGWRSCSSHSWGCIVILTVDHAAWVVTLSHWLLIMGGLLLSCSEYILHFAYAIKCYVTVCLQLAFPSPENFSS